MNLKCKLTIEWDEGNVDDWIEALLDDGHTYFEALDEIEDWIREQQSDKIKEWAIRNLPDCTTDLDFEWSD